MNANRLGYSRLFTEWTVITGKKGQPPRDTHLYMKNVLEDVDPVHKYWLSESKDLKAASIGPD